MFRFQYIKKMPLQFFSLSIHALFVLECVRVYVNKVSFYFCFFSIYLNDFSKWLRQKVI